MNPYPATEKENINSKKIPIIDKGIFGQSRAVSASCCVAFHSAYGRTLIDDDAEKTEIRPLEASIPLSIIEKLTG